MLRDIRANSAICNLSRQIEDIHHLRRHGHFMRHPLTFTLCDTLPAYV